MQSTPFTPVARFLTKDQNPRVWSLLISVFGDLAQKEGSCISGALLRQLTGTIGIKPEAVRVAIHRLRKDGWIDSQRSGRTSMYSLTNWGRAQSAQASPRIYATRQTADRAWLVLFNPAVPAPEDHSSGAWISTNVLVTSAEPPSGQVFISPLQQGVAVPDWISGKLCEEMTGRMAQDFAKALDLVVTQLAPAPPLTPLEVAALRVLLVHGWRRIILKTPRLPDHVFARHWSGPQCRDMVASLLSRYPTPELDVLEAAVKDAPKSGAAPS